MLLLKLFRQSIDGLVYEGNDDSLYSWRSPDVVTGQPILFADCLMLTCEPVLPLIPVLGCLISASLMTPCRRRLPKVGFVSHEVVATEA